MKKLCVVLLLALIAVAPAWGAIVTGEDHAKVAFDSINKRYMRVYRSTSTGVSWSISAMIFNADGSVYSDNPIRLSAVCDDPAVAFDANSSQYLVVWTESVGGNVDIYGQLVSATGVNVGSVIRFTTDAGDQVSPSVACDSTGRFFVVWTDNSTGNGDIIGKFMTGGTPDALSTPVCDDGSAQKFPDVAFSPALNRFMVVWTDSRIGNADIWGALFFETSRLSTFQVSRNSDTSDQDSPRVACAPTGDSFLVCFRDGLSNSVAGQLVTGSGLGILNGSSIAISTVGQSADDDFALSVAFGNDRYLVTWIDCRNPASGDDIYGQYLTAAGQPIDANFAVNTEAGDQFNPYVAGNSADGSFLAGWGYTSGTTVYHFKSTILNAPVTPTPGGGSSGGGGGGCFIESIGGGWQMLAGLLSGLLLIAGVRRR